MSTEMKTRAWMLFVAALLALGMKQHYGAARADDLRWMLTPTAHVAGLLTGIGFEWQAGEGYFSEDRLFVIEKSCAGINFLVAAFGMLTLTFAHRAASGPEAWRVLSLGCLASYAAAVVVNATRIAGAMWLAAHPGTLPLLTAAEVHRVEGVAIYFGGLVLVYELARRVDRTAPERRGVA